MSDVLVLCYHALSPDWPADLSVTPDRFEAQAELLVRRGYVGATFEQALTAPPGPRTVAITFDDAYRSVFELALPVMRRLGLPGSIYVPTDWVGRQEPMSWEGIDRWVGGPHQHELACLEWDELGQLADAGWEVGSHTRSHPHLTRIDDEQLTAELEGSRAACAEALGRPCRSVAYPYGDVDGRVVAAARASGYAFGAALPVGRFRGSAPLDWPREGIYNGDDPRRFRLKVSPLVRRLRGRLARPHLDGVRLADRGHDHAEAEDAPAHRRGDPQL
ncbi:MAG TPA: polysaccharide deacetylase family protein [Thermoleophilaceae bacterium]|jgi:peptidoglycan/xylan/chitin deacetylase (PgdA/CDA1 family)